MKERCVIIGFFAAAALGMLQQAHGDDVDVTLDSNNGSSSFTVYNSDSFKCLKVQSNARVSVGGDVDPTNVLYVYGAGTQPGGVPGWNEVVARFRDWSGHSAVSVDAMPDYDAILYLAKDGEAVWGFRNDHSAGDDLQIRYHGGSGAARTVFTVETNTYVGIGAAVNPQAPLHVWSPGNWDLNETDGDFKVGTGFYGLQVGVATGGGGAGDVRMRSQGIGSNRLILGGGSNDVLTVRETGVGIGTLTPDGALDIEAAIQGPVASVYNNWPGTYGGFSESTVQFCLTGALGEGYATSIGIYADADVAADLNGDVDISADLDVGSTLTVGSSATIAGNLLANGGSVNIGGGAYTLEVTGNAAKTSGGMWSVLSDERLKENVVPLTGALDRITQLRGVQFEWINPEEHGGDTMVQAGMIAQEVAAVAPEWVIPASVNGEDRSLLSEPDDALAIALPNGFNAYVIEAFKELKTTCDTMRTENELLRQRVEQLEAALKAGE